MVGPGYLTREKQKFPLDHLLEFVSEKPSVKKCINQISSKNIHKGNSLRDVLHKSVSLVCKGDHGRLSEGEVRLGRYSDALNGSLATEGRV